MLLTVECNFSTQHTNTCLAMLEERNIGFQYVITTSFKYRYIGESFQVYNLPD